MRDAAKAQLVLDWATEERKKGSQETIDALWKAEDEKPIVAGAGDYRRQRGAGLSHPVDLPVHRRDLDAEVTSLAAQLSLRRLVTY